MSPAHKPSPGKWRDAGSGMQGPQKLLGGVGAVKAAAQNLVLRSKASCDVRCVCVVYLLAAGSELHIRYRHPRDFQCSDKQAQIMLLHILFVEMSHR